MGTTVKSAYRKLSDERLPRQRPEPAGSGDDSWGKI